MERIRLTETEEKIINQLRKDPSISYRKMARNLKVPLQTVVRAIHSLEKRAIVHPPKVNIYFPKFGLKHYCVYFYTREIAQLNLLCLACDEHPHTVYRAYFFGERSGIYASFQITHEGFSLLKEFLDKLLERNYCEKYDIFEHLEYSSVVIQPFSSITPLHRTFNIQEAWEKRKKQETILPKKLQIINLKKLHTIQFMITRDLTRNFRVKEKDLLRKYQQFVEEQKEEWYAIPTGQTNVLEEYIGSKTEGALSVDFHRKMKYVKENLVGSKGSLTSVSPQLNYEIIAQIIVQNVDEAEQARIFHLLRNVYFPLQFAVVLIQNGLHFYMRGHKQHIAELVYLLRESYRNVKLYFIDNLGNHGTGYPFYIENYDFTERKWKTDRKWIVDDALESLSQKTKNTNFDKLTRKFNPTQV